MRTDRRHQTTPSPPTAGAIAEDTPPSAELPREIVRSVSWGGVAAAVATLLIAFLALNSAAGLYLGRYTPNLGYWLIDRKWALAEAAEGPVEWLVLGDSSCNQGVDPEVWSAHFGTRPLNLCTLGDMLVLDDVWILRRLLDRGVTPEHILVVHAYDTWDRELRPELLGQIPDRSVWRAGDPAVDLTWREAALELVSRYVPIVSQNGALFEILVNPGIWFEAQYSLTADGFMTVTEADPAAVHRDTERHLERLRTEPFAPLPGNVEALDDLRTLARMHDLAIYVAAAPVYEGLAGREEFAQRIALVDGMLAEWAASDPHLHAIPDIVALPASQMRVTDHATREGARFYTERIATAVRVASSGVRK